MNSKLSIPRLLAPGLVALAALFGGCVTAATPAGPTAGMPAARAAVPVAAPAAPAPPQAAASVPAPSAELASRWAAVVDAVGPASCSSAAECRSIAVGAKACGGPERYLAWSTRSSDEAKLRQRVEAYNAARQADNEKSGRISNCMMLMDPGATCEAGRCVTPTQGGSPVLR